MLSTLMLTAHSFGGGLQHSIMALWPERAGSATSARDTGGCDLSQSWYDRTIQMGSGNNVHQLGRKLARCQ